MKRTVLILAHILGLARTEKLERAFAFAAQAYKAAHAAAIHPAKEWKYGWPLLGLEEPDMPARVPYTPGEFAALAAWHKDAAVIEKAMSGKTTTGEASSSRDEGGGCRKELGGGGGNAQARRKPDPKGGGKGSPPAAGGQPA